MNNLTEYEKNRILTESLINKKVYCALLGDNEITNSDYKRVEISFEKPKNGQTYNNKDIEFPIANSNWGDIKKIAIFDSVTSGNKMWESEPEVVKSIGEASQYKIPIGYMIVRLR